MPREIDVPKSAYADGEVGRNTVHNVPASLTLEELLDWEFPEREPLLGDWLTRQALSMVHAWRGTGKTFFGLEVAYAVASGGQFLKWTAPKPRRVLYLDGEMPGSVLQERVKIIEASTDQEMPEGHLRFVTPDIQSGPMLDLATTEGQEHVEPLIADVDLIVVDNLSCLARRGGKENEGESWIPVADWALQQRAAGRSVLFIHHSGKGGLQRGTSRREDLLDVVIALRRPADYQPEEGARFVVAFEKARGLTGDAVAEFEARFEVNAEGQRLWTTRACEDAELARIVEMFLAGASQKEVGEELGVSRYIVRRRTQTAITKGLITREAMRSAARSVDID